jgi:murein DD-endopeptidase MepM/ murein hydrolase activator NlpD
VSDLHARGSLPYPWREVDYPATITQEFRDPSHLGVDVAYQRIATSDRPEYAPPHDSDASGKYFSPPGTPILAARDGKVWSVGKSPRGISVVLSHAKPWATFYQHLESCVLPAHAEGRLASGGDGMTVRAGDVIGRMGWDPLDPEGFRHLHFAVWYKGSGDKASVDPVVAMRTWKRSTWSL